MPDSTEMRDRARYLRHEATRAERRLWARLRGGKVSGLKFRCQAPVGRYIADFACFDPRLIVECDGGQHAESDYDARRDAWFTGHGFQVMRFWNNQIADNLDGVVDTITRAAGKG